MYRKRISFSTDSTIFECDENFQVDVVVVGAGVSGLTAAYQLLKKDSSLRVVVLEAKERIGGRTLGRELTAANGKDEWDLGGQWVGSCQPHIMSLLKELELEVYDQFTQGKKVAQLAGDRVSTYKSEIPSLPIFALLDLHFFMKRLEKMIQLVPVEDPSLCPYAKEWDSMTFQQALDRWMWTDTAKDVVKAAGRTIFAVESHHISLLYYLMYAAAAGGLEPIISARKDLGGQEFKVKGGAFQVCEKLLEKIGRDKIHLGEPVTCIEEQEADRVHVTTLRKRCFKCSRVIVAVPPHEAAKLIFLPSLPVEKMHVFQRMPVGYLTKVIVTYQTTFWRERGLSGEAVTAGGKSIIKGCAKGPLSVVFDATTPSGNPALVSFIGGEQQFQYSQLMPEDRRRAVLHSLSELLGPEAAQPLDYCEKNWNDEPYNGGGPVSVGTPGMMTLIASALRDPYDRIHFAGSESATVWCGFLNGAVQAGIRAANEVLYKLNPEVLSLPERQDTVYLRSKTPPRKPQQLTRKFFCGIVGLGVACVLVVAGKKVLTRFTVTT